MRGKRGDMEALVQVVATVWNGVGLVAAFGNVWNRLGRVLHLFEEDKGGNELVEKKPGKRWAALDEQPFATPAAFAAATAAEAAAAVIK